MDVYKAYRVYVALKALGFGRASQISGLSGIPLRTTYVILGRMLDAGIDQSNEENKIRSNRSE